MPELDSRKDAAALPEVGFETQFKDFYSPLSEEPILGAASPSLPEATLPAIPGAVLPEEINIKIGMGQKKAEAGGV